MFIRVAGVTFSDSGSVRVPKFSNTDLGPAILQICEPTPVQTPATIINPTLIFACFCLRNNHTDFCYCWNWKATPGPVFPKFLTPYPGPNKNVESCRRRLRLPDPAHPWCSCSSTQFCLAENWIRIRYLLSFETENWKCWLLRHYINFLCELNFIGQHIFNVSPWTRNCPNHYTRETQQPNVIYIQIVL